MKYMCLSEGLRVLALCIPLIAAGCLSDAMRVQDFPVKVDCAKGYVDAKPRKVSIRGKIGDGPHYSKAEKYPGKILQIRLKKRKLSSPDQVSAYGSKIIPGSDNKECEVWCRFRGKIGATAVGGFWLYVRHEKR